ncbi:MAG: hypothetical protein QOJ29_1837 [Thermoleophilaceae bacterium]|jgi:biotin carboxylase|nr:hypothetical protein [Thermoleophilaceae bacterium]
MTSSHAILVVNVRRAPHEARAALRTIWRLGFRVAMLTDNPAVAASGLVDDYEVVDTYDHDAALAAARRLAGRTELAGIVTWADRDVGLVAKLGEALGLPALSREAARRARDKFAMKDALAHLEGVVPRHAQATSLEEARACLDRLGCPAILKPIGGNGSKGVIRIDDPGDLDAAWTFTSDVAQATRDRIFAEFPDRFLLEEYLDGPEISVEGWTAAGQVAIAAVTGKASELPYHVEYRHLVPAELTPQQDREVRTKTELLVKTLGFDNCGFHVEAKLTPDGFRLVEVAARLGGGYINSHLVPLALGIDVYAATIRAACGEFVPAEPTHVRPVCAGVRYVLARQPGRFAALRGSDEVLTDPDVQHFFVEIARGTPVALPPADFLTFRSAAIVATHPDRAALESTLERLAERCEIVLD